MDAGRAWGERAVDWAYLMEPYARRANKTVFGRVGVGPGTRLLDIACDCGYAAALAAERGALVSGLDASEGLIDIARARTPAGDLRGGDMFALPFADSSFDVATSRPCTRSARSASLRRLPRRCDRSTSRDSVFASRPSSVGLWGAFQALEDR